MERRWPPYLLGLLERKGANTSGPYIRPLGYGNPLSLLSYNILYLFMFQTKHIYFYKLYVFFYGLFLIMIFFLLKFYCRESKGLLYF